MPRTKPTGIPAASFLANRGISRHGSSCRCACCAPDVHLRQSIPIIRAAGVLHPPTRPCRICGSSPCDPADHVFADASGPSEPRTFDELHAAARAAIAEFERTAS